MSDVGTGSIPTVQRRGATAHVRGMIPIRVQCARCPNRTLKYMKVHTLYAYRQGDPRIRSTGSDREVHTSYWCLNCVRGANIEEDDMRTVPSVNVS